MFFSLKISGNIWNFQVTRPIKTCVQSPYIIKEKYLYSFVGLRGKFIDSNSGPVHQDRAQDQDEVRRGVQPLRQGKQHS